MLFAFMIRSMIRVLFYTGWAKSHIGLLTFKIFFIVVVIIMKFQHNINKSQEIYLGNFNKGTK